MIFKRFDIPIVLGGVLRSVLMLLHFNSFGSNDLILDLMFLTVRVATIKLSSFYSV